MVRQGRNRGHRGVCKRRRLRTRRGQQCESGSRRGGRCGTRRCESGRTACKDVAPAEPHEASWGRSRHWGVECVPTDRRVRRRLGRRRKGRRYGRTRCRSNMIQLPGYDYLGPLGTPGNFGAVFHARNQLSGQDVAIKHIDEAMSDQAVAAWESEASAMAACQHGNLVRILHAEITPHGPALVMEYLPDGSVAARYGDQPTPVGDVIQIAVDVCWGLHRLHVEGLTHRDIKPGNLLLSGDAVKLGDFGLAGGRSDPADVTYVAHKPPEVQLGGPWSEVADLFALGVTAWRLLWGDSRSGRQDPDLLGRLQAGQWPDRGRWPNHVHRRLRTTLRSAMHPDATKRPVSAADLRGRLETARPMVSWCPRGDTLWSGTGAGVEWTVELTESGTLRSIETTRDLGRGPRRVSAGCVRGLAAIDADSVVGDLLQRVAVDGTL